jgi:glutamate racemase
MNKESKPIGIFDSGIGGLTVLKELCKKLPHENTVYLGDTARVPYGIRSPETVTRYSFENTRFLFSKEVKMIVVACNTASSVSLESIRNAAPVPFVGVIGPGAKAAAAATENKKIGIIGTEATIKSNSYAQAIKSIDSDIEVFGIACPLFVPLVEEGWTEGKIAEMIAQEYLREIKRKDIDTLVLGCTHYPLLKGTLAAVMGENVRLIDSAIETALEVEAILKNLSLLNTSGGKIREFFVTDSPEKFKTVGEIFLGEHIHHIKKIELEMEV